MTRYTRLISRLWWRSDVYLWFVFAEHPFSLLLPPAFFFLLALLWVIFPTRDLGMRRSPPCGTIQFYPSDTARRRVPASISPESSARPGARLPHSPSSGYKNSKLLSRRSQQRGASCLGLPNTHNLRRETFRIRGFVDVWLGFLVPLHLYLRRHVQFSGFNGLTNDWTRDLWMDNSLPVLYRPSLPSDRKTNNLIMKSCKPCSCLWECGANLRHLKKCSGMVVFFDGKNDFWNGCISIVRDLDSGVDCFLHGSQCYQYSTDWTKDLYR